MNTHYEAAAKAASDAYDAIFDAHRADAAADFTDVDSVGRQRAHHCICGREFKTNNGRGLHLGWAHTKASQAFDTAWAETRDALRDGTLVVTNPETYDVVTVESVEYAHINCEGCYGAAVSAYAIAHVTGSVGATQIDGQHSAKIARAYRLSDDGYEIKQYI